MVRCGGCDACYLDPRPTPATLGLAYASYYTHAAPNADSDDFLSSCTFVGWRFRALRNAYLKQRFPALSLQPVLPLGGGLLKLFPGTRILADRDVRHLPAPGPGARLVDIGCGSGSFVRRAGILGYAALGLEFDRQAVDAAAASGLTIRQGSLPDTGLPDGSFDAATLSQVIEHVHDPIAALREVRRILKPGGFLWVATPNAGAAGHARYGADWRGLEPPRHLVLFSPEALERALKEAGFAHIRFHPVGDVSEWFFQASRRIADRLAPGTPVTLSPTEQAEARRLDALARRDPRVGEELVVSARAG
jgi:2-polyprenyl-3-methyl-5-hydroxy-6-metoxy-1,4-benzoquinol methylase